MQWMGKHIPSSMNMHVITEELSEAVSYMVILAHFSS
jgi:hypothetical protein